MTIMQIFAALETPSSTVAVETVAMETTPATTAVKTADDVASSSQRATPEEVAMTSERGYGMTSSSHVDDVTTAMTSAQRVPDDDVRQQGAR